MKKQHLNHLLSLINELQKNAMSMLQEEVSPPSPPKKEKEYLNQKEAAKFLGVSVPTFRLLKIDPMFPRASRIRKQYRYDKEDLILFLRLKKDEK